VNERAKFRPDLYAGAAEYYDKFRLAYPEAMLADLASRVALDGSGGLLDVACGTGQVAFALAPHIAYIVGIDQEPGMVNFAAAKAAAMQLRNSEWHVARAEEFGADGFRLVTIGNAFHRLDRPAVAERARQWLQPGGFLALLWSSNVLEGSSQWQLTLDACVREWVNRLDTADRVPATWASDIERLPHSTVLTNAGFDIVGQYEFTSSHDWSVAGLIGLLYSTSYFPRAALGEHVDEFETDLATRLGSVESSGVFRENITSTYELAVSPARA
jgi:ubiquinone/menaquinone biosynthesis C-methylase UbiE